MVRRGVTGASFSAILDRRRGDVEGVRYSGRLQHWERERLKTSRGCRVRPSISVRRQSQLVNEKTINRRI